MEELVRLPKKRLAGQVAEAAELLHQHGALLFGQQRYDDAERFFERALQLQPDTALYALKLGWTLFKNPARPLKERLSNARPHLEMAAALDAYNADARYCMAAYWRELGREDRYRKELQAVLRCDGHHSRARRELDELLVRLETRKTSKSSPLDKRHASGPKVRKRGLLGLFKRE